ncbi:MAG: D-alanyl-D-alanine carboxypeptidase, partial [Candidatus Obscuribacterales bacterium]|nr:D-alanyl-D-alanine carboxypeptidase [Candidatus Obscuribacterales bacterium]
PRKGIYSALSLILICSSTVQAGVAPHNKAHSHKRSSHARHSSRVFAVTGTSKHVDQSPPLAEMEGYVIQDASGKVIQSSNASEKFNPASTLKLATALLALRRYGPETILSTRLTYSGKIDKDGQLDGDLFLLGGNPLFKRGMAQRFAKELNDKGIRSVKGNIYVSSDLRFDNVSGVEAGQKIKTLWESAPIRYSRKRKQNIAIGSRVAISGDVQIGEAKPDSLEVCTQVTPKMKTLLKLMLCYSINGIADELGNMMGGPQKLNNFVVNSIHVDKNDASFSSCSGLGINRITPLAMAKIITALRADLKLHHYDLTDILPVAGVDAGTLEKRFTAPDRSGTVVAKTGTLIQTDSGVSALAGEMKTKNDGPLTFVIFEQHGSVMKFVKRQEEIVLKTQDEHGGPDKLVYQPVDLSFFD